MCLIIDKDAVAKTALEDITCFKVLRMVESELVTPYFYMPVKIGETYTSDLVIEKLKYCTVISNGMHSFRSHHDAVVELNRMKYRSYGIARCTIPAGALYYDGIYNNNLISSASETITYNEIIN